MTSYGRTKLLLPPAAAAGVLLLATALHFGTGALGLLVIVFFGACLLCLPGALTNRIVIDSDMLRVRGVPPYSTFNATAKPVALSKLSAAYLVHLRSSPVGTEVRGRGPLLVLEDEFKSRQRVPLTFVSNVEDLKDRLRSAVRLSQLEVDPATAAKLGFGSSDSGSTSKVISSRIVKVSLRGPGRR